MEAPDEMITGDRMVTRELAEWVAGLRYEDLPDDVTNEAAMAFTDFLGETLFVGATQPWGQSIADFCAREGGGQPEATIIALGTKTLCSRAALANGTMALGFEYADFGAGSRPYPFAVTAPLALAEMRHKSGKELILSIVIGYEVMWRMFKGFMDPPLYSGFYVPALLGTIGASAACARLLDLSTDYTNYALGLACAFTGGTFQGHEEGAWQRSLNGGMAGERAVTAALLAETGFKATQLGLEGVQGFARMYTDSRIDVAGLLDGLGDSWCITNRWVKRYPMNATLQAPVQALLNIMRDNNLKHTEIESIEAAWQKVEPFLAKRKVHTVVAAQASLPFALAMAAVRGQVTVDEFTQETVDDPEIQALIPKLTVYQDTELFKKVTNSMPARITIRTTDGREFTDEVLYPKGNPNNRLTEDEFKDKYLSMAVRVLGQDQADELYRRARDLANVGDVADLAPLFSPK